MLVEVGAQGFEGDEFGQVRAQTFREFGFEGCGGGMVVGRVDGELRGGGQSATG
jgi:hypothetical protein